MGCCLEWGMGASGQLDEGGQGSLWGQQMFSWHAPALPCPILMNAVSTPSLLRCPLALIALAGALPLAAQNAPGGFSLPEPTPTPSPAPAGPADERAGVAIPPRTATPAPRIAPAPVLTGEPVPAPSPRPTPLRLPPPAPRPAAQATPTSAAPAASATPEAAATAAPPPAAPTAPTPTPEPGFGGLAAPASPFGTPEDGPQLASLPAWWPFAAAGLGGLVLLGAGLVLWRRRKPKVLRLAAPVAVAERDTDEPTLPRIDLSLDITGATRSVMTFTLRYRLTLANRSGRAVNDLAVAVQLASARRGGSNAPSVAAAQGVTRVERIGPHQSRTISGEVQLPVTAIVPVIQGSTPLFIPLLHVTLEGEGQSALTRSFVIGTPGTGAEGRVQPLLLTTPPGGLPPLKARAIDPPPAA